MAIDLDALIAQITRAASDVLQRDVKEVAGFSERQLKALAQQAALVESGIRTGQITEETRDFFLDSLQEMALNFVKTLRGLVAVTVEKVWNAVVGVIWQAIEAGTGVVLPLPRRT